MSDPWSKTPDQQSFGRKGTAVTPSDTADLTDVAKAITVTASGTLSIIPVDNGDADTIDYGDVPVGFTPPYLVRRVMSTGTTATVATVDG